MAIKAFDFREEYLVETDYDYRVIDLGVVREDEPLGIAGFSLAIKDMVGTAFVRFSSLERPRIPIHAGEVYVLRFSEVFLTNPPQPGMFIEIFVGKVR